MTISIIIPNFNGQSLLEKNLPILFECIKDYNNVEIIVVDDGSTDGSVEYLEKLKIKSEKLKVKINRNNYGFAYSCNLGVKEAKGEVVILFNNDVFPKNNFLSPLLPHFQNPSVFAVGCKEINGLERGRAAGMFKKGFLVHKRADNQNKNNTLWVAGGSGAFRKSLFEKLGGFDEIYKPFYWEDIDLSYRALKAGYQVLFEPKSEVTHHHEQTIGKFFARINIETISYRNSFIFVWKNITDKKLLLNHFFWLPINITKAIITGNKGFLIGFFQAIKILPKVVRQRKKVKSLFKKTDGEVLKEFINE